MAAPIIANSNGASAPDHNRKGSVTMAPGPHGQMANGGHSHSASRPNINFGSVNVAQGPNPTTTTSSTPPNPQSSSLPPPASDPRVRSPAASPSPIPQPAASGGTRPPSIVGNGMNFGSVGNPESDRQSPAAPQAAAVMPGQQQAHNRRTSSQSVHSDAGNNGMPMGAGRGGFVPQGGRGRNYSGQGFPQQMPYSPAQQFRPSPGNQRPGSIPHHFQGQLGHPGSPHIPPRSPALSGSQPGTPHMQHMAVSNSQMGYHYPPPQYPQHLEQQNFAPMQGYQQGIGYYQQPYIGHPQYMNAGAPPSPRHQFQQVPPTQRQSYIQGQYSQHPGAAPNMSRTSSQVSASDRPASSLSGAQHPGPPSHPSHTPSQSQSSIAPPPAAAAAAAGGSANFTIPKKASKGIVIKNPDGEVINFNKSSSAAAAAAAAGGAKAPSPAPSSSAAPTPPPRSESTVSNTRAASHTRSESKSGKTAEEIKAQFQEAVKRNASNQIKEEPKPAVSEDSDQTKPAASETPAVVKSDAPAESTDAPKADAAATTKKEETEAERKQREEEEFERMVAEMEAEDAKREAEQNAISERKAKEKADREAAEKAKKDASDEEMKRLEREAEALEEKRAQEGKSAEQTAEDKAEADKLFKSLSKPTLGPGAEGAEQPASDDSMPPPPAPKASTPTAGTKPKPSALKLDTVKNVEPAQPTPGMRSLRSARLLQLQSETVSYPEGIQSPNPALNQGTRRSGKVYDTDFLLQFKDAFKEKPSLEWDEKLKAIVGDPDGPKSARTPGSSRQASHRGLPSTGSMGPMGSFASSGRTLPSGTTSEQRFQASQSSAGRPPSMQNPLAAMGNLRAGSSFPMGAGMGMGGRGSMPSQSGRGGRGGSRNDSRRGPSSRKEQENLAKTMPLTAGQDLKPIEVTASGWKPMSKTAPTGPDASGHMDPAMVQRKVKSNLNKMTPENFDRIAEQILSIASQSKDEVDGRTLRQVIQLTFEKACDEAHWASMYAKFCKLMLEQMSPDIKDENVKDKTGNPVVGGPLFRKYLLNRCQDEFEKGWQVNLPETKEGESEEAAMLSDEYYIAAAAKRKGLGLIQFIGELYKLNMLSIRIMHQCVCKLLDFEGPPDEAAIESLVKLLRTVGGTMEASEQGPQLLKTYFERIQRIMSIQGLPSRMHFMLLDTVELRKDGWKSKNDAKGPKTIQEIREEALAAQQKAELEKNRRTQGGGPRMPQGRGDARNFSGPPPDYNRNTVGTDDLRRLQKNSASRGAGGPARGLGPTSMFASRSNSGRPGLGPGMNNSGSSSRTGSRKAEEKPEEEKSTVNSFSALAALDNDGGAEKSPAASPALTKATPAAAASTTAAASAPAQAANDGERQAGDSKPAGDDA